MIKICQPHFWAEILQKFMAWECEFWNHLFLKVFKNSIQLSKDVKTNITYSWYSIFSWSSRSGHKQYGWATIYDRLNLGNREIIICRTPCHHAYTVPPCTMHHTPCAIPLCHHKCTIPPCHHTPRHAAWTMHHTLKNCTSTEHSMQNHTQLKPYEPHTAHCDRHATRHTWRTITFTIQAIALHMIVPWFRLTTHSLGQIRSCHFADKYSQSSVFIGVNNFNETKRLKFYWNPIWDHFLQFHSLITSWERVQ